MLRHVGCTRQTNDLQAVIQHHLSTQCLPSSETEKHLPTKKGLLLNPPGNWIIIIIWILTESNHCGQPLNLSKTSDNTISPKHMALNIEVLNMVLFIAPLTNVGNAIRLPQDIANINVWNTPEISLMFLKTGMTTMITYLLMQIITNLVNAESPID